jgi:hypothetical protein
MNVLLNITVLIIVLTSWVLHAEGYFLSIFFIKFMFFTLSISWLSEG